MPYDLVDARCTGSRTTVKVVLIFNQYPVLYPILAVTRYLLPENHLVVDVDALGVIVVIQFDQIDIPLFYAWA
jgi:hypothetical protein